MQHVYIVDFADIVQDFQRRMSHKDLPVVDAAVAFWLIFSSLESPGTEVERRGRLGGICQHLSNKELIVEYPEWMTRLEEQRIRAHLYQALLIMGEDIYARLSQLGILKPNQWCRLHEPLANGTIDGLYFLSDSDTTPA